MLSSIGPSIGDSEVRRLTQALRQKGSHVAGAEWEIAVKYGLSTQGTIGPASHSANKPQLDALFSPNADPSATAQLEVTTVSDAQRPDRLRSNAAVANRLKRKHAQSLRSDQSHPVLLVVVDNDCYALRRLRHPLVQSAEHLVELLLNGRGEWKEGPWLMQEELRPIAPRISGVLLLALRDGGGSFGARSVRISPTFIPNINSGQLSAAVIESIEPALRALPPLRQLPMNGRVSLGLPDHYGGGFATIAEAESTFRYSLGAIRRTFLESSISAERFARDHHGMIDLMRRAVDRGLRLVSAHVEVCADEDDDWLILEFGRVVRS